MKEMKQYLFRAGTAMPAISGEAADLMAKMDTNKDNLVSQPRVGKQPRAKRRGGGPAIGSMLRAPTTQAAHVEHHACCLAIGA